MIAPKEIHPAKTWPWILLFLVLLFGALLIPQIYRFTLDWDLRLAWWFNSLLGTNKMLDLTIAHLNSKNGDRAIAVGFCLFFLIHSLCGGNRNEICRRMAFWGAVSIFFIILYQGQRVLEDLYSRNSPARVLDGWFDLSKAYDMKVKTRNSSSWPSGHSMAYYFVSFMALHRYRKLCAILLPIALVFPTTRIASGAHWPSDIFLGALPLALLFAALCYETPLWNLNRFLEMVCLKAMDIPMARHSRPFRERFASAWAEFFEATPRSERLRLQGIPGCSENCPEPKSPPEVKNQESP